MNRFINENTLLDNLRKRYYGHLGIEESDECMAFMTFKGICNVIKNTESYDSNDIYIKAIEDFISWAYINGIDFSYMGKGEKNGKWFCDNIKERFITTKIYFIPFKNELTENELNDILNDNRVKELLKTNSLFVELGYNENKFCVDILKACCRVKDIKNDGCYVTLCNNDNGTYLKNCLDNKQSNIYMGKSIIVSDSMFRLVKFNVVVGGDSE